MSILSMILRKYDIVHALLKYLPFLNPLASKYVNLWVLSNLFFKIFKMFKKFRKIKKYVLSNPFLFFADYLLKASRSHNIPSWQTYIIWGVNSSHSIIVECRKGKQTYPHFLSLKNQILRYAYSIAYNNIYYLSLCGKGIAIITANDGF